MLCLPQWLSTLPLPLQSLQELPILRSQEWIRQQALCGEGMRSTCCVIKFRKVKAVRSSRLLWERSGATGWSGIHLPGAWLGQGDRWCKPPSVTR